MQIRIKDKRQGVFTVDNVVLNHYGQAMGATGIALYVTLCRFANNQNQTCYPSLTTIMNETGMDRKTVISAAERLEKLILIDKEVKQGSHTIYTLLEPIADGGEKDIVLAEYYDWWKNHTGGKSPVTGGKTTHKRTKITNLDNTSYEVLEAEPQDKRVPELQELVEYADSLMFVLQGSKQSNRFSAYNLLKRFGLGKSKQFVEMAVKIRGRQFAPAINDFTSLYRKTGDLINYYAKEADERTNRKTVIG